MRGQCIVKGTPRPDGYTEGSWNGVRDYQHRIAYAKANGLTLEAIKGVVIRHKCDNRACRNPDHLEPGTHQDNTNDMMQRGRHWTTKHEERENAKITMEIARAIRTRYKPRCKVNGGRAMAREFGISDATIRELLANEIWKEEA